MNLPAETPNPFASTQPRAPGGIAKPAEIFEEPGLGAFSEARVFDRFTDGASTDTLEM